jgi:hypothetical protein
MRAHDMLEISISPETGNTPTIEQQIELTTLLLKIIDLVTKQLGGASAYYHLHWKASTRAYGNALMDITVQLVERKGIPFLFHIRGRHSFTLYTDLTPTINIEELATICLARIQR